ncbi:hypothetical protein AK812_SmicGene11904 [Symbiodinium microadriaticum]|uniref:Uncharacterized protein n=1 Tax=Symbiodinium microadriaticum TaxID=2951 RepID=A0A1Q9EC03_SYMMI|nr:hypothetical protein AK812_SmicGene11904 [Symbiodinium microadriaticum]
MRDRYNSLQICRAPPYAMHARFKVYPMPPSHSKVKCGIAADATHTRPLLNEGGMPSDAPAEPLLHPAAESTRRGALPTCPATAECWAEDAISAAEKQRVTSDGSSFGIFRAEISEYAEV